MKENIFERESLKLHLYIHSKMWNCWNNLPRTVNVLYNKANKKVINKIKTKVKLITTMVIKF